MSETSRGDGYVPREPEPVEDQHYAIAWVVFLPNAQRLRKAADCMPTSTPWWRRLGRQLVPRRGGLDCCWYHQGDWHKATKTAIRYLRQARRAGIAVDDTYCYVMDLAEREKASPGGSWTPRPACSYRPSRWTVL
jgi:hypothetical protein